MNHAKADIGDVASETIRIQQFLTRVEGEMNSSVLGTEKRPIVWKCPFDADKKQVGTICLNNVRTRRVLKALMELVDIWVKCTGSPRFASGMQVPFSD